MWEYTPRQIEAFLVIAGHRRKREMSAELRLSALAAQGDSKAIRDALKDLES